MPTTRGYDPGFVGAAYEAPNYLQDTQKCVNYYPEISPDPHAKEVIAMMGAPGTVDLDILNSGTPVRQAWVLPGGTRALAVCGPNIYLITEDATGTVHSNQVGTLLTPIGPVQIRDNGYVAVIVDGAYGYTYLLNTGAFAQITDPNFTGFASRVAMIDGWFIFNQANSRNFYISPQYLGINGNSNQGLQNTHWDATQFAVADATGDLLVSLIEDQRLLWLPKENATEVWYDAGAQFFTFNRMQGVLPQIGCAAPQSVARVTKGLMWLAHNERGQNFVIRTQGFDYDRVSTHAIDYAISSYSTISDALGWTYIENGHEFYVLTFPTADVTWVYDTLSGLWHERLSFDPVLGQYHRHRGNCVINFQNRRLIGTWDTGALAWMDRSQYLDGANPLVAWRRTGHIWDKQSRRRMFHHQLQIETAPGAGNAGLPQVPGIPIGGGGSAGDVNTIVLMHFDGSNGGTVFTDVVGHSFSVGAGTPTTSTTQIKFGTASLELAPNAFTNQFYITSTSSDFNVLTTNGTLECWIYSVQTINLSCFAEVIDAHGNYFEFTATASTTPGQGSIGLTYFDTVISSSHTVGFNSPSTAYTLTPNTWHSIAIVVNAGQMSCFVDGIGWETTSFTLTYDLATLQGMSLPNTSPITFNVGGSFVGAFPHAFNGFVDELRLSNIARYTANYTPATGPFGGMIAFRVRDPHMILRWSDDGAKTFGNEKLLPMGQIGQYKNRAVAYNLGYSRDRVYDLRITDAVNRDIIGATLMSETEQ